MAEDKLFYTSDEAKEYLGFKQVLSIRKHAKNGTLKGTQVNGRMWVFTKQQLDEFKATVRKPGPKPKGQTE